MNTHINFLDYAFAATRREQAFVAEEDKWDRTSELPKAVLRLYLRRDVFLRDASRMIGLGYRIARLDDAASDGGSFRVIYELTTGTE